MALGTVGLSEDLHMHDDNQKAMITIKHKDFVNRLILTVMELIWKAGGFFRFQVYNKDENFGNTFLVPWV